MVLILPPWLTIQVKMMAASFYHNTSKPESTLKKKCNVIAYHFMWKSVTMKESLTGYEGSEDNPSDLLTKVINGKKKKHLVSLVLYDKYDEDTQRSAWTIFQAGKPLWWLSNRLHEYMLEGARKVWPWTLIGSGGSGPKLPEELTSACALSDSWGRSSSEWPTCNSMRTQFWLVHVHQPDDIFWLVVLLCVNNSPWPLTVCPKF